MSVQHPTVADFMASHLFTLSPDADIHDAVNFLLENRISGAPVVEGGRLVGMLSEKDCLRLLTVGAEHSAANGRVCDFMTKEVTTIRPDMNIYFAAGIFLQKPIRRIPVVDEGVLLGQISRRDILRAIKQRQDNRR